MEVAREPRSDGGGGILSQGHGRACFHQFKVGGGTTMLNNVHASASPCGLSAVAQYRRAVAPGVRWLGLALLVLFFMAVAPLMAAQASTAGQDTSAGDAEAGKSLFTGSERFEGGGPPCLACHSVAGIGALGGGALGPNLTETSWKGPALGPFMDLVLDPSQSSTYPTMNSVWSNNTPLTAQEKADMGAFLLSADVTQRETQAVFQLSGLAVVGTLLMLGLSHLLWRRRSRSVRRTMVARETR